jgi:hypothetical protein
MCVPISIESVISNYFSFNENKKQVSLVDLSLYKREIEKRFIDKNEIVFINYTNSDLGRMLRTNSDLFELRNDNILVNNIDILKKEMPFFNSKLPRSIKDDYLEIFKQVNEEVNECA